MREIKYRVRLQDLNDESNTYTQFYRLDDLLNGWNPSALWKIISRDEWTGLQDRNGIEAYEGDIIKAGNSIGVIFYNLDSFNIEWKVDRDFWNEHPRYHVPNGEVIGNIYESPHLLDKPI